MVLERPFPLGPVWSLPNYKPTEWAREFLERLESCGLGEIDLGREQAQGPFGAAEDTGAKKSLRMMSERARQGLGHYEYAYCVPGFAV